EAARRYERVVQVGTQRRSAASVASAAAFVRAGKLGKVPCVRTWIAGHRPTIGHKPDGPVPPGVDYDLWLGPAPQRPFNPNRFHYNWHWHWDYGNAELGNTGVHDMDIIVWGTRKRELPAKVVSLGGRFGYEDDGQTPN